VIELYCVHSIGSTYQYLSTIFQHQLDSYTISDISSSSQGAFIRVRHAKMQLFQQFAAVYSLLSPSTSNAPVLSRTPPGLSYLYTATVECSAGIYTTHTPKGIRTSIPIVGGNFTGPRLNGKILNLGADWGLTDPQTGIFAPDTRYQLQTDSGANIYVQTSGAMQPDKTVHLRLVFETGDKAYYWLNNIIGEFGMAENLTPLDKYIDDGKSLAVGILQITQVHTDGSMVLQIDVWNVSWKEIQSLCQPLTCCSWVMNGRKQDL